MSRRILYGESTTGSVCGESGLASAVNKHMLQKLYTMHPIPVEKTGKMAPDEVTERVYAMLLSPLNRIFDDNISKANTLVLIVVLFSTCLIGDGILSYIYSTHVWTRAGIDSATHEEIIINLNLKSCPDVFYMESQQPEVYVASRVSLPL